MGKLCACVLCFLLLAAMPMTAQAPGISEMYALIRAEETNNSKIMWIIHEIADVYGPRVTGTPNLKAADDWAVKTMTSWGLANTHLEPWTFQPPSAATPVPGWENMELLAEAVTPFHGQLMVMPLAWTPSTKGVVTAQVVMLQPPGLAPPTGAGFQFLWRRAATRRTEMGSTADAGSTEASGTEAADPGGARYVFEFDEGQSSRSDRVCGKTRGSAGGHEPGAHAAA